MPVDLTADLTLAELRAMRRSIIVARSAGTRRVTYIASGVERTIEMRSDMELRQAQASIEAEIAATQGESSVKLVSLRGVKGWDRTGTEGK